MSVSENNNTDIVAIGTSPTDEVLENGKFSHK
jgi:hypothetical protein